VNTDINVLGDAVKVIGRGKGDEATGSEQNAKRSQRAGRLKINGTRKENDVREPSIIEEVLRGRDRSKGPSEIRASFKRVKGDSFKSPITENQKRVLGMKSYLVRGIGCS